jgi:hypothetical protein
MTHVHCQQQIAWLYILSLRACTSIQNTSYLSIRVSLTHSLTFNSTLDQALRYVERLIERCTNNDSTKPVVVEVITLEHGALEQGFCEYQLYQPDLLWMN